MSTSDRLIGHYGSQSDFQVIDDLTRPSIEGCVISYSDEVLINQNAYRWTSVNSDTPNLDYVVERLVLWSGTWRLFALANYGGAYIDVAVPDDNQKVEILDISTYGPLVNAGMSSVRSFKLIYCSKVPPPKPPAPITLYSGGPGIPEGDWAQTTRLATIDDMGNLSAEAINIGGAWLPAYISLGTWRGGLINLNGVLETAGTDNPQPFTSTHSNPVPCDLYEDMPDLTQLNFNDVTRSVIVREGRWRLYRNANYSGQYIDLGVGQYPIAQTLSTLWADDLANGVTSVKRISESEVTPPLIQPSNGVEWHESTSFMLIDGSYQNIKKLQPGDILLCVAPHQLFLGKFNYYQLFPQGSGDSLNFPANEVRPYQGKVRVKSISYIKTVTQAEGSGYWYFKSQNNGELLFRGGTMPKRGGEFAGIAETQLIMRSRPRSDSHPMNNYYTATQPGLTSQGFNGNSWNGDPNNWKPLKYSADHGFNNYGLLRTRANDPQAAGDVYNLELEPVDSQSSAVIIANGYYLLNLSLVSTPVVPDIPNTPPTTPTPPVPPGSGGCFSADTPILLADGTTSPISQLAIGSKLKSFQIFGVPKSNDFDDYRDWWATKLNFKAVDVTITAIYAAPFDWHVELFTKDEAGNPRLPIKATPEHPFLVQRQNAWRFVKAVFIRAGDFLFDYKRGPILVEGIGRRYAPATYYNLDVDGYNLYIADGSVVHNTSVYDVDKATYTIDFGYASDVTSSVSDSTVLK